MQALPDHFALSVIAPRRTGKTYFLCTALREGLTIPFDHIFTMSPTIGQNQAFLEFSEHLSQHQIDKIQSTPKLDRYGHPTGECIKLLPIEERRKFHMIEEVSDGFIADIIEDQKDVINRVRSRESKGDYSMRIPRLLLIFDDCLESDAVRHHGTLNSVAYLGRHLHISFIVMSQHFNKIGKGIRLNSDMIILMRPFSVSEMETFLDQFSLRGSRRQNMQRFMSIFDEKYQFIVLNNMADTYEERFCCSFAQDFVNEKEMRRIPLGDDV